MQFPFANVFVIYLNYIMSEVIVLLFLIFYKKK